jgi:hypothetical protein
MIGDFVFDQWEETFEEYLFKNFGYNGKEAYWPVGR